MLPADAPTARDGRLNSIKINRLKDKPGNKANALSEIEYLDAYAYLVGEEGKGIRTILSSAEYTRLDFAVGSAGLMRAALSQALHYSDYRSAFGAPLSQLPIQAPVLAGLAWSGPAPPISASVSPTPGLPRLPLTRR